MSSCTNSFLCIHGLLPRTRSERDRRTTADSDRTIGVDRAKPTIVATGAPLAALLSFLSGLLVGANRSRAHQLLSVIAWSGVAYAIYGVAFALVDPATGIFRVRPIPLTSTFVNRNTAAVYFGACSVIWLLLVCERIRQRVLDERSNRDLTRIIDHQQWWLAQFVLLLTMMVICLLATFMTGSRAGVSVSLLGFVVAVVGFFDRDLVGRRGVLIAVGAGCGLALLTLYFLAGNVVARFYRGCDRPHPSFPLPLDFANDFGPPLVWNWAGDLCFGFSRLPQ